MRQVSGTASLAIGLCLVAAAGFALEGGYPSSHRDWQKPPEMARPDSTPRAQERQARQQAIHAGYGWVPDGPLGPRTVRP